MQEEFTIESIVRTELKEKGSKFIGTAFPLSQMGEIEDTLQKIRKEFSDATHHCYAYRFNSNQYRWNDGGEPSGTAGRPIYGFLEAENLVRILVVVTRYFGGTKLGAAGLVRAYSDCTQQTLQSAKIIVYYDMEHIRVQLPYNELSWLQQLTGNYKGKILHTQFSTDILSEISIPKNFLRYFLDQIQSHPSGKIKVLK